MYKKLKQEITDYVFEEAAPEKSEIIFVPGNGYPQMAEEAARLYLAGFAPYILPSGRYSVVRGSFDRVMVRGAFYAGPYRTEWEFLNDVLIKNGVPREAILKEDRATMTYENATYSRRVTDEMGIEVKKAILCCKNYHAGRAVTYYRRAFPQTELLVCPAVVDGITRDNWFQSEEGIDAVLGEVRRSVHQFSFLMDEEE